MDDHLGRTNYEAQETDEPADPDRPDNLWAPVPGDHGAHGTFDARAYDSSQQLWANMHRGWLAVGVAGATGLVWAAFRRRRAARATVARALAI